MLKTNKTKFKFFFSYYYIMGNRCTSADNIAEIVLENIGDVGGEILEQIISNHVDIRIADFEARHYFATLYLKGDHMNIKIANNIDMTKLRYINVKNQLNEKIKLTIKSIEVPSE